MERIQAIALSTLSELSLTLVTGRAVGQTRRLVSLTSWSAGGGDVVGPSCKHYAPYVARACMRGPGVVGGRKISRGVLSSFSTAVARLFTSTPPVLPHSAFALH
jgi:hypothetical protein